ncbi:MAG: bifunctional riboflavin kinase/FAD synthetase [Ruminococcaceae bacterium]|nr:bifunctional riboflavin kinase/FAD synthetase [Oscillospiraceae bacterium]
MNKEKKIVALGFFDGVHLGHQALLKACVNLARQLNMDPAAITFHRHPKTLFTDTVPPLLNSLEDRSRLLRQYGMAQIITVPVSPVVMKMPWQEFLSILLNEGAAGFVCGEDFRFGFRGEGTAELLEGFCRERNLPCVTVPDQTLEGVRISSTHIRDLIESGQMDEAVRFLGHPHILSGQVVQGQQLGRKIGIPTANLVIPQGVLVPKFGVYACRITTEQGEFSAVTNVGTRPTVAGSGVTVEPWILDFDGDLYGKTVTLEFHRFLRPEKKFDSLSELQAEIRKNAMQTREFFL